jgi:hypothetical protein
MSILLFYASFFKIYATHITFFRITIKKEGKYVGMFSDRGRVCVFFIDGKDHDQQHNDNSMEMESSTVKSNNDCWIPFRFLDDRQI